MVERYRPSRRDEGDDRRGGRDDPPPRDRERGSSSKWRYEPQRAEDIQAEANRTGGRFDSIFKSGFDTWRPKAGENLIRFLPGTWGLGVPYAFGIWLHRYVGADDSTYLCLDKMLGKFCPICERAAEAKRARDDEESKALRAVEQRAAWILDREGENKKTPLLFTMSWTMNRDILSLTHDKKRKEQLYIDSPTNGYDVTIKRSGTGLSTRYFGMMIDRSASAIADTDREIDDIMDYVEANPIPDLLNYYDAEYIEKVLSGTSGPRDDKEEVVARGGRGDRAEAPARERAREPEPEREAPRRGREPEPEPETARGGRRAARDEVRDEDDADRGGRERKEPDDAPSRRSGREDTEDAPRRGREREEPSDDRRSARGNGRDDPPFDADQRDDDSRPRRAARDEEPERGARPSREPGPEDEDRRPARRR